MFEEDDQINAALARMASYQPNPRDSGLGERWRDEEERTLGRLEGGNEYGLGEILRDVLPGAIGAGADIISNNGRGLGDIAQLSLSQANQNAARDQQRMLADREYALKQRAQREQSSGGSDFDRAYKTANIANARQGRQLQGENLARRDIALGQGERKVQIAEDTHSYNYNPEDKRALDLVDDLIAGGMDPRARGLPTEALKDRKVVTDKEVDHAWNNIEAGDKANVSAATSAATTGARIKTEGQLADVAAGTAAKEAGARSEASTRERIETEGELADVSAGVKNKEAAASTQGRLGAEADVAEEGFVGPLARAELDPERVRLIARDPKMAKEARDKLGASAGIVSILSDMRDIRAKEAQGLAKPGTSRSFFDANRVQLEGLIARGNDMGVLNEGDRRAVGSFLGASGAGWLDLSGLLGSDVKLEQLEGVRNAFLEADRREAANYGYDSFGTARSATTQRRPAARAQPGAAPAAAPSTSAPQGGGMVTIRLGGETRQVPADQAQRLKAINPSLEVL